MQEWIFPLHSGRPTGNEIAKGIVQNAKVNMRVKNTMAYGHSRNFAI
jgi:hypothetical protein